MSRLAKRAYEAYANSTGWKSLATGQPLPPWDALPETIQAAWQASVTDCDRLHRALAGLVGTADRAELEQMELAIRSANVCEQDRASSLNAIHALIETL